LLIAALPPTLVAIGCLWGFRGSLGEVFDLQLWQRWYSELDRPFLFLFILPFVIAAVGLWAELIRDKGKVNEKNPTPATDR
jgi:hypothetical protein